MSLAFQAVLFDMDGLMLDTERLARAIWYDVMREHGYTLTDAVYLNILGTTESETIRIFQQAFGTDAPILEMFYAKQQRLRASVLQGKLNLKPGLLRLLDWLERRQVMRAVATSTYRGLALEKLGVTGLIARFHAVVAGDEVPRGKPAPDLFLEAARRLNVAPSRCVVLEDSDNGARAAVAAGMRVIVVPDLKAPSDDVRRAAWHIAASLDEAARILAEACDEMA